MRGTHSLFRILIAAVSSGIPGLCVQPAPAEPPATPPVPVIDVHAHFFGRSSSWREDGVIKTTIETMDRFAIRKSLIMPPPQIARQPLYDHAEITKALRGHSDRFAFLGGGGRLNALVHRHVDLTVVNDELRRRFVSSARDIIDAGAVGFGEMASLHISARQGHPYEFVPADHPLLKLLADVAAERDVPIDLHLDAISSRMAPPARFAAGENPPLLPETLAALERLLAHNIKARIVWAHGGSDPLGAMTVTVIDRLIQSHPNLFVSLRIVGEAAPMHNKVLAAGALEPGWRDLLLRHADRFMIGTDSFFPATGHKGSAPASFFAQSTVPKLIAMRHALALLPSDVAIKVANENAARVYRLNAK